MYKVTGVNVWWLRGGSSENNFANVSTECSSRSPWCEVDRKKIIFRHQVVFL